MSKALLKALRVLPISIASSKVSARLTTLTGKSAKSIISCGRIINMRAFIPREHHANISIRMEMEWMEMLLSRSSRRNRNNNIKSMG